MHLAVNGWAGDEGSLAGKEGEGNVHACRGCGGGDNIDAEIREPSKTIINRFIA